LRNFFAGGSWGVSKNISELKNALCSRPQALAHIDVALPIK